MTDAKASETTEELDEAAEGDPKRPQFKALFLALGADQQDEVISHLEECGCEVFCRDRRTRGLQLLTATKMDLVLLGLQLTDADGLQFCAEFRKDSGFHGIPLVVIGGEGDGGTNCVQALDNGADDFIPDPYNPKVFRARIRRLLRKRSRAAVASSSLSVQVSSGELPGVVSFLEAEVKTGKLLVRCGSNTAVIYFREGRLVNATAPNCEGTSAITEALCWPTSHVTFEDCEVADADIKFNLEPTGTLMNCVFEVDEFHEAQNLLPAADVMFVAGPEPLPPDATREQKLLAGLAVEGYTIEHMVRGQRLSERQATMCLRELIEKKHIVASDPPFANYSADAHRHCSHHSSRFLENRLLEVKNALTAITFPITPPTGKIPFAPADWVTPEPRLLVIGDSREHMQALRASLEVLVTSQTNARPPSRTLRGGVKITRYRFGEKQALDVAELPAVLSTAVVTAMDEILEEACALLVMVTDQGRKTVQSIGLAVRQLRIRFKSICYHVVPQVRNKHGEYSFHMDCHQCGYSLAVDMALAGSTGECPICNANVTIPDAMDHLAEVMHLPDDVPIVLLQPTSAKHVRDLMLFLIDSVLNACAPPPDSDAPLKHSTQILSHTEVKGRVAKQDFHPVQLEDLAASRLTPEPPPVPPPANLPTIAAPRRAAAAPPPAEEPPAHATAFPFSLDELIDEDPAATNSDSGVENTIDEIINTDDDAFDIDDFIRKVRK